MEGQKKNEAGKLCEILLRIPISLIYSGIKQMELGIHLSSTKGPECGLGGCHVWHRQVPKLHSNYWCRTGIEKAYGSDKVLDVVLIIPRMLCNLWF